MSRNNVSRLFKCSLLGCLLVCGALASGQASSSTNTLSPADLGVSFVDGSSSKIMVEHNGKKYAVDLATHEIRIVDGSSSVAPTAQEQPAAKANQAGATTSESAQATVYKPGDDFLFNVPTGRPVDRHSLVINFTHRFAYEAAFTGPGRGDVLLGLDDFSVSSFGFRYGITSKLSVFAYRSPSIIGRPIELMAAYNFLDEHHGNHLNAAFRFSVDAQNDFENNFSENFELIVSRSLGHRAQFYAVPTYTIHQRPVISNPGAALADDMPNQPCSAQFAAGIPTSFNARPCANTFSIGAGVSVDIRRTVALVAEVTPTLVNGDEMAIHRPEYAFGIQKKIWRHAFTLGFSNGAGTIVSQRAGTRATLVGDPSADKLSGMFIGFDLTRQLF
jgi:Membrane bound beta barrel domain (DUF5777)